MGQNKQQACRVQANDQLALRGHLTDPEAFQSEGDSLREIEAVLEEH